MSLLKGIGGFVSTLLGIGMSLGILAFGAVISFVGGAALILMVVGVLMLVLLREIWCHFFPRKRRATAPSP